MNEPIASTNLVFVTPEGKHLPVTISIGRPHLEDDGLWSCPISMRGLYQKLSPMKSDDSLHALCLGIFLIRNLLTGFVEDGGRILTEKAGEELPIEAYFPPLST